MFFGLFGTTDKEKGIDKLNSVRTVFSGLMTNLKEARSHLIDHKDCNVSLQVALENENEEIDAALADTTEMHEGLKKLVK
jgi:hypothetical protein